MSAIRTTIWIIVYLALLLLIYISYGVGMTSHEFPNKYTRSTAIWTLFAISIVTFIMTAFLHILEYKSAAALMLILSISTDAILGALVGTIDESNNFNPTLAYIVISPIVYKLFLFMFLNWDSCTGSVESSISRASSDLQSRLRL